MYVLIMENVAIRAKITEIFHINPIKFVYECIIQTNIVLYNKVCIINLCIFINCWHTILKSKDFSHWFLHKSFIFHPIEILILSKKSTTSHLQLLYNDLHYNQLTNTLSTIFSSTPRKYNSRGAVILRPRESNGS